MGVVFTNIEHTYVIRFIVGMYLGYHNCTETPIEKQFTPVKPKINFSFYNKT